MPTLPSDTLPRRAGILCGDPRFQRFAAERLGLAGHQLTNSAASEYLRRFCHIASRRDLTTDPAGQLQFAILRTEFDRWLGKIAGPR